MVYSRVKDGVIYCTVSEHYDIEVSNMDYWIGHSNKKLGVKCAKYRRKTINLYSNK